MKLWFSFWISACICAGVFGQGMVVNPYRFASLAAPVNTVRPAIDNNAPSGTGVTLTATHGTYSNAVASYVMQWKRQGTNIAGATDLTYVTAAADQGLLLSFYEKAVNTAGDSGFVRADSRLPRPFFICGDSTLAGTTLFNGGALAPLVQTALTTNWLVINTAVSADNILQMEGRAQGLVDPFFDKGWGVCWFFEYANSCIGLQGTNSGVVTASLLHDFGTNRRFAGAGAVITATSWYRTNMEHSYVGTEAHIASEILRTNYSTYADGFVELDTDPLYQNVTNNDGIHQNLNAGESATFVVNITNKLYQLGLVGGCGGIPVPNAPAMDHLRTFSTATYVYDPVNPLPSDIPFQPDSSCYLVITSGTGFQLGCFLVGGKIEDFPTDDGNQRLYSLSPPQTTGGLSGGHYYFTNTACPPN